MHGLVYTVSLINYKLILLFIFSNFQVAAINLNYFDSGLFGLYQSVMAVLLKRYHLDSYLSCILDCQTY